MREIKFRVWDKEKKKMYYGVENAYDTLGYMKDKNGNNLKYWWSSFGEILELAKERALDLSEYTGLKDKNGVEIYEGDILDHKTNYAPYKCVMEWRDDLGSCGCCYDACGSVGFVGRVLSGSDYTYSTLAKEYEKMEVIGNIYENPELLTIV